MTETRRNLPQEALNYALETLRAIKAFRADGLNAASELANALNRTGQTDARGQQWNAQSVMGFLASRECRLAEFKLSKEG
jgi:hypothetical protein